MPKKKDHKMKHSKMEIPCSICAQVGCEFYGKPAAQGIWGTAPQRITQESQ